MKVKRRDSLPKQGAREDLLEMTLEPTFKEQTEFSQVRK
jgi:hypothetical protein